MKTTTTPTRTNWTFETKKLVALLVIAFTISYSFAWNQANSILNLRLTDNAPFRVFIDGQPVGGISSIQTIPNLSQGTHTLQIHKISRGYANTNYDRSLKTSLIIGYNTENFVTINMRYGSINFDRVIALNNCPNDWDNDNCQNPRDTYYPYKPRPEMVPLPEPCAITSINAYDFAQLRNTMNNAGFESTKISILKQALPYNYFTTSQVCELMSLFNFESTKLEVAKLAYNKTIDQNNYYLVNNEFTFSSSVNNLGDYIAMK